MDKLAESDSALLEDCLKLFHSSDNDTSKINALTAICEIMVDETWEKYQFYQVDLIKKVVQKKLNLKELTSLKITLANAFNNIGVIHVLHGKTTLGLNNFQTSLKLKEELNDRIGVSDGLSNLGIFYYRQGNIPLAMEYYEKSLKVKEELGDKKGKAVVYESIGIIHKEQGDISPALYYYKKSLALYEELNFKQGISQLCNNIGTLYKSKGDFPLAMDCFRKSLEIREKIGDKKGIAESLNNIGQSYQDQGDFKLAMEYCQKSMLLRKELGDKAGLVFSYHDMGEIYLRNGNLKTAQEMAETGLSMANEISMPVAINRHANLLCNIYEAQGDGLKALKMHRLSVQMKDSLNNEETQRAAIRQQTKYEFEKVRAISEAEHQNQLTIEKEAKAKQSIITYFTAGTLGLVGVFLIVVFNRLKVTRKQKGIIEVAHQVLEEKNREITDSINYAKRIQSAILPPTKLFKEYLPNSFILYKPKDIVAGDFYWLEYKNGKILFAVADCTGHGVPGAMVSVICNNGLNRSVREHGLTDPGQILDRTREIVIEEFEKSEEEVKDGMDIALCSLASGKLQFAGANNPLWIIRNGEVIEIKADKQPIGKTREIEPFTTRAFNLEHGDAIYVFSDGYVDQFGGGKGKKFKAKALKELLLSIQDKTMEDQKRIIDEAFEKWKGKLEQIDDVCVVGIKF